MKVDVTISAELAPDNQAETVRLAVTQGAVLIAEQTVGAHDARAVFALDEGDYVAHAEAIDGDGTPGAAASQSFGVASVTAVTLEIE